VVRQPQRGERASQPVVPHELQARRLAVAGGERVREVRRLAEEVRALSYGATAEYPCQVEVSDKVSWTRLSDCRDDRSENAFLDEPSEDYFISEGGIHAYPFAQ